MFDLLPPNAAEAERALSQAIARMADGVQTPTRQTWSPDNAPAEVLPWLAWAFSVDDWDSGWTVQQKREVIKRSVAVHRYKGTIGAVREALGALGFEVVLTEWFRQLPEGDPYTFDLTINVDQSQADQTDLVALLKSIEAAKNLRSHLGQIKPSVSTLAPTHIAGASCLGTDTTVESGYGSEVLVFLMMAAAEGYAETEAAVDDLHILLNETMPSNNYW